MFSFIEIRPPPGFQSGAIRNIKFSPGARSPLIKQRGGKASVQCCGWRFWDLIAAHCTVCAGFLGNLADSTSSNILKLTVAGTCIALCIKMDLIHWYEDLKLEIGESSDSWHFDNSHCWHAYCSCAENSWKGAFTSSNFWSHLDTSSWRE